MDNEKRIYKLCCIYILEGADRSFYIGLTGNLKQRMADYATGQIRVDNSAGSKLVYYRWFSDTMSAVGYKLLLNELPTESVEYLIRRMNPDKTNLITKI